jgi:hypothetical protein
MTLIRKTHRTFGQFLPSGTTPKVASGNNTLTVTPGGPGTITSLRLRTDIEMYVLATGTGSANINLAAFFETIMVVGSIMYVGGSVASSYTPLTNQDALPTTGLLSGWGQWEYLYPSIDFVNTLTPQVALCTWRPKDKTIDTQFRRTNSTTAGIDLWMPWEIQDGSGLINTTTSGVTYNLGVRFAQSWVSELRT